MVVRNPNFRCVYHTMWATGFFVPNLSIWHDAPLLVGKLTKLIDLKIW